MIKKMAFLVVGLFWFSSVLANTIGYSYVTVTNNTSQNIVIKPSLTTTSTNFNKGRDWDGNELVLSPYETKEVLWFSRDQNVTQNQAFQFDLTASNSHYPNEILAARFVMVGQWLGSSLKAYLNLPNTLLQPILEKDGLEKYNGNFWGNTHTCYARTWLPVGNVFNSYQFVIHEINNNVVSTPSNHEISLLTYNTQLMPFYANTVNDLNQPEKRVKSIPKIIAQYDVVILQELFDRDLRNTAIKEMENHYPFHTNVVGYKTDKILTGGVIIFSKWPIIKEDQMVFDAGTGVDALAAKGVLYAAINKQGKIYHIVGTHMQASQDEKSIFIRNMQLIEMLNYISHLQISKDEPLLIGGDFNINQFNSEINTLLNTLNVNLLENKGYPYSIDGTIDTMQVSKDKLRIDYVFSSNNHQIPLFAFNKVFILRDLDNESMWPKFDLSDHFPVASYFNFPS